MPSCPAPGTTLLSDCGGAIRRLALCLPPPYLQPRHGRKLAAIGKLCSSLPADTTLVVLTERSAGTSVKAWLATAGLTCRHEVAATAADGALTADGAVWMQDNFLCGTKGEAEAYILPERTSRSIDHGPMLSGFDGTQTLLAPVALDGGNCLVGPTFWIVGADSVSFTARDFAGQDRSDAAGAIAALDSRELHVAGYHTGDLDENKSKATAAPARSGNLRQPWFHIDLMISVTGLLDAGRSVLVVANALGTADMSGPCASQASRLDAMARRLESEGFKTVRNPVPVLPVPSSAAGSVPAPRSYNNVILQHAPRRVWLPQFADLEPDLEACDQANVDVWSELGFEVTPVPGWSAFAAGGGALRCAAKVLGRA